MAKRVQVQGDLFHGRVLDGAVYVGRQAPGLGRSKWANPFRVGKPSPVEVDWIGARWVAVSEATWAPSSAAEAVTAFEVLARAPRYRRAVRAELAGMDLACWCREGAWCHGNVLLAIANSTPASTLTVPVTASQMADAGLPWGKDAAAAGVVLP